LLRSKKKINIENEEEVSLHSDITFMDGLTFFRGRMIIRLICLL